MYKGDRKLIPILSLIIIYVKKIGSMYISDIVQHLESIEQVIASSQFYDNMITIGNKLEYFKKWAQMFATVMP